MLLIQHHIAITFMLSIALKLAISEDIIAERLETIRRQVIKLQSEGLIERDYEPYSQGKFDDEEFYDFIVVGAGSAGSALTHRLVEVDKWRILLLEAGGEPDILSEIPFWSIFTYATKLNWNYTTEPEDNLSLGFKNRRISWHRGKGLGGSSLLNYMVFSRGTKEDYDKWANLGNPGWSYEDVLPYFKKLENVQFGKADEEVRGFTGPVSVEDTHLTKSGETFIEAAIKNGYLSIDYNGRSNHGVSRAQGILKKGKRCSGELCYLRPIKNKRNLTIRTNSHVTNILIKDKKAYGVEYSKDGSKFKAYASKEVILSAGTINSAQLLLLSGIGPKEQLRKFEIEPILDLPVGRRIRDHMGYVGLGFSYNESITLDSNAALTNEAVKEFYNGGSGVLTSLGTVEVVTFTNTPLAPSDETDIELVYFSSAISDDLQLGVAGVLGVDQDLFDEIYRYNTGNPTATCLPILLHPKSHGYMELRSSNPFDYPKMYSGYFNDPEGVDMKKMIAGIRECIRISLSPPFDRYNATLVRQPVLRCGNLEEDSDEYWECAVRHLTNTVWHQTETCKMGPADDPEAVVDNRLRVYGTRALRVVDLSVVPIGIAGHTAIPAFMIGEKAADIIKEEYL